MIDLYCPIAKFIILSGNLSTKKDIGDVRASLAIALISPPLGAISALISAKAFADLARVDSSLPMRVAHMDIFFGSIEAAGALICIFTSCIAIKDLSRSKRM